MSLNYTRLDPRIMYKDNNGVNYFLLLACGDY